MSIFLKHTWQPVIDEIWNELRTGPDDVYIPLLEFYYNVLRIDITKHPEVLNNPELASDEFSKLPSPDTERMCIQILEGFYTILNESYDEALAKQYETILKKIYEKYNLRYTVLTNCRIGLSVQGVLDSMLFTLRKSVNNDYHRNQTIEIMEENIAKLENTIASSKNCISDANNLLEGAIIDKANDGSDTLGVALRGCPPDMFAHESLKFAVSHLYKFFSDQPNIRHPGRSQNVSTPPNPRQTTVPEPTRLRDVKASDAILSTALAISFASFIRTEDDGKAILDGDI